MATNIENIIAEVYDGRYQHRAWEETQGIMLHRCGVNLVDKIVIGYDGRTVAKAFSGKLPEWEVVATRTGKQNAYTVFVGSDCGPEEYNGKLWQALPMDEIGWHGRQFSAGYIGLAWIADPRVKSLSEKAWWSMADICAMICSARLWNPADAIKGHGEVPTAHDGTKAPGEINACPGLSKKDLNIFRGDVAALMKEKNLQALLDIGLTFKA